MCPAFERWGSSQAFPTTGRKMGEPVMPDPVGSRDFLCVVLQHKEWFHQLPEVPSGSVLVHRLPRGKYFQINSVVLHFNVLTIVQFSI